ADLDGHSLDDVIDQNTESKHDVLHWAWRTGWAVRRGDWKLIKPLRSETLELVSLTGDEPETMNYAGQRPEIVAELFALHQAWLAEVTPSEAAGR
ncbi:MAG: sulfatase, partial [Phycisphaeraceae bacterium]